jgi:valyl-tRNA synthetase
VKTAATVTRALEACAFDEAATALYRFIWNVFCDWYVELAKPVLQGEDEAAKAETRATAAWTLDQCLRLLHPVSPFLTEELWDRLGQTGPARANLLIAERWPDLPEAWVDPAAEAEIGWLITLVEEVRSIRSTLNMPNSARAPLVLTGASAETRARAARHDELIRFLARLDSVTVADSPPAGAVPFVIGEATASLSVAGLIDVAAEVARLKKDVAAHDKDIAQTRRKLDNADFIARAPEEVVEENRERLAEAEAARAKLQAALERLEDAPAE